MRCFSRNRIKVRSFDSIRVCRGQMIYGLSENEQSFHFPSESLKEIPSATRLLSASPTSQRLLRIIRIRELSPSYSLVRMLVFFLSLAGSLLTRNTTRPCTQGPKYPRIYQETSETFYSRNFPRFFCRATRVYFSRIRVSRKNFFTTRNIFPTRRLTALFNNAD